MKTLKEIIYKYAQLRGGGLPLNAEEVSDCVVQWVQQFVEEQVSNAFNKFVSKQYVDGLIDELRAEIALLKGK